MALAKALKWIYVHIVDAFLHARICGFKPKEQDAAPFSKWSLGTTRTQ